MKIKSNPKSPPLKRILRKKLIQTRTYLFDNEQDQFLQSSQKMRDQSKFGSIKIQKMLRNPEASLKSSSILNHSLKSQQSTDKKIILRYSEVKSLKKVNEINFRQSKLNIQEYSRTIRQQTTTRKRRVTESDVPHEDQNNQKIFIIRKRIGIPCNNLNMSRMVKQSPRNKRIINYQKCLTIYTCSQCSIGKKMEIRNVLGIGANAQVREGESQGNKYAIKIYQKHKICSKTKKQRIYTEIKILSSLPRHPNIINLLQAYESKNQIHIIFEHMDRAVTLSDYFKQKNYKLSLNEVKKIFLKLTKGVNHLHNNNVTHRDLKPANIVLSFDQDGEMVLKIIDFGVATNQIKSDLLCGTRNFIAPELINKNKDVNLSKCDVWALGVILFYLCQGRYPFTGNNEIQLYSNIKRGNFYYETQQPSQIMDIIKKILVVDPCRRISAQQILKHNWFYQN